MKIIPDWLLSAISDGETPSHTSSGRLIALLIVLCSVVLVSIIWAEISLLNGHLQDIPASVIGFMSAAGALAGSLYAITKIKE